MKSFKILAFVALLAIATFLSGNPSHAKVVNQIAAIVNNEVITETELQAELERKQGERKNESEIKTEITRRNVLDKLVDDKLFDQLVGKAKIEISDDELARAIAGVLQQNRMNLNQLKAELRKNGITYDQYKKNMEKEIKRIKFVNQVIGPQVKITDQDLRDYYQQNQEQFRGSHNAHIAQIILLLNNVQSEADFISLRDKALSIVAKARRGKSFKELAMKHSDGPNSTGGGDLGMLDLKDTPPIVGNVVRTLKVGEVSNPIFVENKLLIIKLISLPELAPGDFEKLRENINAAVYDQRMEETMNSYLLRERQRAFIEIR